MQPQADYLRAFANNAIDREQSRWWRLRSRRLFRR
jgi:hypothetical protein